MEYRESGLSWLGRVPGHWRVVRNGSLFGQRNRTGYEGLPILEVSLKTGVRVRDFESSTRKQVMSNLSKYKRAKKGDVSYNMMRMWQGAVGVSPVDGLVSPAYVVLSPRSDTCPDFYDHVFHTDIYKQEVNRQSTGIVSDRNRLYWDSFKQMPNVAMPRSEQEAIAGFIHSETSDLNTARFRLEREIDLLREYRTRLVADVVTGKLDVREAAARLPDEAQPAIVEDDAELDETELADEGGAE